MRDNLIEVSMLMVNMKLGSIGVSRVSNKAT